MDFGFVANVAIGIINKLDLCQRNMSNTENTLAQLERNIKAAKISEAAPPPRPTTQAPGVQTPSGEEPVRKASINFGVKELAALRQKRKSETSGVEAFAQSNEGRTANRGAESD